MNVEMTDKEADSLVAILISGRAGLRGAAKAKRERGDVLGSVRADTLADFSETFSSRLLDAKAAS